LEIHVKRKTAEEILVAYERAQLALNEVETAIRKIEDREEQKVFMLALAGSMADLLFKVRAPLLSQYPELDASDPEDAEPQGPSEEEVDRMRSASKADEAAIDALVLRECTGSWQKVAKIVGDLMAELDHAHPHLPLAYVQARMEELEDKGLVEIAGDVWAMRYSEIRIAQ
jgi:hypothetical protein